MAWSLLGSPRNGQAELYLFQKTFTLLYTVRSWSRHGLVAARPASERLGRVIPVSKNMYIAAVGTAWPLLGPPQNGQAELYLYQKHLLRWACINSFSHYVHF